MPVYNFKPHTSAVNQIYISPRNRTFLTIDAHGTAHLNYSTTNQTQISFKPFDNTIQTGAIAPKSNGIILIDSKNQIGQYKLEDEHPEATLETLFSKVWYEGYEKPEFVWQSTGGSDEFEPKFSLIPLIFGTLKGTLYAMLFSIPLALLAAIYVSQFSPRWLSGYIKPTVEIMAALPSVVIGFLAGLYFSPIFEEHLMAIFLVMVIVPLISLLGILGWRLVPEVQRMRMPLGWELVLTAALFIFSIWISFSFATPIENLLFNADIKQWLYETLNVTYDQRNSLVVGFALGFAVIPIIFTISEDALSNVPDSLTSASLALGASRWQTVYRVVVPAAAGGIFAAVMLGLGRAIGETMIVLMATGNTPILDLSPFNGFRAMSACIAVEIPEAPVGGTLYRILFLTAFLLFIFTFAINSIAARISDKLRKKYARF
jgi:phosphate transport system permease protein